VRERVGAEGLVRLGFKELGGKPERQGGKFNLGNDEKENIPVEADAWGKS
jgi:hypothetical protein